MRGRDKREVLINVLSSSVSGGGVDTGGVKRGLIKKKNHLWDDGAFWTLKPGEKQIICPQMQN